MTSRPSTVPLRLPNIPTSRELIAAKRREYLALCEIAQDSAQLLQYLSTTAEQQSLMTDGGAGELKLPSSFQKAEESARRNGGGEPSETTSGDTDDKKVLLRVELDEPQA
ncbi:11467_t:CDS:2 [Acaulospora colombiana]|uniref:11467_t:CDS:1 n=1 Tax=Acaulospora colombiana TaxID=27376 RepID=A0ACA9PPD5_9GLOM|nr:11467_t:CDS:2 [Acaulospora colombiana]